MKLLKPRKNFRPFEYLPAYKFWEYQINHPWTPDQINVKADVQSYHTEFTEAEKHGVNTVLKLFTTYETKVEDYWTTVVYKWFKPFEIRMMASAFANMETVHAVFYDKLNEALHLSNKEFYLEFLDDPVLKERVATIDKFLKVNFKSDLPLSLAAFSFIEGVVLYSSFAFLLSFPKRNKLTNVANGIAYSVRDENLHAQGDSWLFNQLLKEMKIQSTALEKEVSEIAEAVTQLEFKIIDQIFAKGEIADISKRDLKTFVKSRVNKKLQDINMKPIYAVSENPIAGWFYNDINAPEFADFFATNSTEYSHNWAFSGVKW